MLAKYKRVHVTTKSSLRILDTCIIQFWQTSFFSGNKMIKVIPGISSCCMERLLMCHWEHVSRHVCLCVTARVSMCHGGSCRSQEYCTEQTLIARCVSKANHFIFVFKQSTTKKCALQQKQYFMKINKKVYTQKVKWKQYMLCCCKICDINIPKDFCNYVPASDVIINSLLFVTLSWQLALNSNSTRW